MITGRKGTCRWMRVVVLSAMAVSLWGCSGATVDEDKPASEFRKEVLVKLAAMDQRITNVKDDKNRLSQANATAVENATELAEEKIETLRDSSIPALMDAATEDQKSTIKSQINDTLKEIEQQIAKAEGITEDVAGEREKFIENRQKQLARLRKRLDQLQKEAEQTADATRAKLDQTLESAEEAIDQAGSSLDAYQGAAQDQADQLKTSVEDLIEKARDEINQAAETVAEKTES